MASKSVAFPEKIGRFRVEAVLGSGGMGEVYKAIDPTLRRTVAVKTVRPDISNPDYLGRLLREAQACASLHHPHIVTVYEAGEIDGVVYIVMEYLEGEDLAQVLQRGELTFEERLRTLIQVLAALEHAHSKGVIHRDIKPANVRRLPDGTVKLVDFGLARVAKAETLTATGMVMGTPHYASPEQLRGELVDRRTDVYSAGAMAYEMCSGRRPFESGNASLTTVILKVVSDPPPPMDVPFSRSFPEIERIVTRAMAKSRDDRYQSAEDLKNAFAAFLGSSNDAISTLQAQQTLTAQMTVIEAKGLIASGKSGAAQTLLSETLRMNPQATGVRRFLEEMDAEPPAPIDTTVSPADEATVRVPASALAATVLDEASRSEPTTRPLAAPPPVAASRHPLAAPRSRQFWWAGGLAAAAVVAVGLMALPGMTDVTSPGTVAADPSAAEHVTLPVVDTPRGNPPGVNPPGVAHIVALPAETTPAPPIRPGNVPTTPAQTALIVPAAAVTAVPRDVGAKQLFYGDVKAVTAGVAPTVGPTGLRYRLTQGSSSGTETDVDPSTAMFRSGDRVRFAFESNIDGYLYVVQEGSSGRWTVLFPSPEINGGMNAIRRGEEYLVPPGGWFAFDANPGTEQVYVVLSKDPLSALPGFNTPVTKLESLNASVVESLQQTIRSRDLTFERDARAQTQGGKIIQASYVVNRTELGKAVAVSLTLNHGQ